jgi:chromosome segregation ATPase
MALTGKKDGWQHQAERFTPALTAVATPTTAATEQARRAPLLQAVPCHPRTRTAELKTRKTEPANELRQERAEFADPEQQAARKAAADWRLNAPRETLAARFAPAATADKRIAELEGDLDLARERIVLLENENNSLQSSRDLMVDENSRLSCRLKESDAAGYRARAKLEKIKTALTSAEAERDRLASAGNEARSQLEQITATLATTEAERVKLSFAVSEARSNLEQMKAVLAIAKAQCITLSSAVDEASEKRQIETNALNNRLAAISERAVTAEKLLAQTQQRLLARTAENCSVERKLAEAAVTHDAAHKKLELVRNSLQAKERQAQELERSRSELIEVATTLLNVFKKRNESLARAEQRIKWLAGLSQLEADNGH